MAIISNRSQFVDYCLRALGAPVVEINVDELQVEERIDDAIEYFRLYHYDGIESLYMKHQMTQEDVDNKYITVPDAIYGVVKVFPVAAGTSTSKNIFDLQYQLRLNDLYSLTSTSIIYYTQTMAHLDLLDFQLNANPFFRFNKLTSKLYIDDSMPEKIGVGNWILVQCYRVMDPSEVPKIWSDPWLKHYATAHIKKQWGTNLKKFDGIQLVGGVTLNGQGIYNEAIQEIKDLEDEILNKSSVLDFFVG